MVKLDEQYTQLMSNHPYGTALYIPLPSNTFQPGSCGYFDDFGDWNPICQILQEEDEAVESSSSPKSKGLSPLKKPIEKAPLEKGISWSPKMSTHMKSVKVPLIAGLPPVPGIPVNISGVYEFSSDKDSGAVLLTSSPITHDRLYHYAEPLKVWMKDNGTAILQQWPEVRNNTLWIIVSTYSTKKCAINLWNSSGCRFNVGLTADVLALAKASAGTDWYKFIKDEGWSEYAMPVDGDDRYVVFFGGLSFQYYRKFDGDKELRPRKRTWFRGTQPIEDDIITIPDPESANAVYEIICDPCLEEDDDSDDDSGSDY